MDPRPLSLLTHSCSVQHWLTGSSVAADLFAVLAELTAGHCLMGCCRVKFIGADPREAAACTGKRLNAVQ